MDRCLVGRVHGSKVKVIPLFLKKKNLIIVDLQCSVNFCCTAKQPSHT